MDVEGSEYPLIEHLRANEVLPLIDEIFIETHFNHPSMAAFGWGTFIAKRPDAHAMLRQVWAAVVPHLICSLSCRPSWCACFCCFSSCIGAVFAI
jgi:hypothetical protein